MPDPLSILGAAGAASQFVEQGMAITKFFYATINAIKDAPELIQNRLEQVQQLISISKLVVQNPSLQVESIERVLRTCLRNVIGLHDMLLKLSVPSDARRLKRWTQGFFTVMKEDCVEKAFLNLDREKANLLLCMETIDS